jgi:hypothetical protein
MFNPDEAELLALGRRGNAEFTPYQTYTTSTSLYLWPLLIELLTKTGVPITLPTARLLNGLFYFSLSSVIPAAQPLFRSSHVRWESQVSDRIGTDAIDERRWKWAHLVAIYVPRSVRSLDDPKRDAELLVGASPFGLVSEWIGIAK